MPSTTPKKENPAECQVALQQCRVTATHWSTVAIWSWDLQSDTCAICKASLADLCITCQTQGMSRSPPAPPPIAPHAPAAPGGGRQLSPGSTAATTTAAALSSSPPFPPSEPATGAGGYSNGVPFLAMPSSQCWIAWGKCGHVYHQHCMSRWLTERSTCPVCGTEWLGLKYTSNE